MTVRAVILAMLGAVFVTTVGYFADHVAHLNRFVAGQFPIMTFGPLVLFVLVLNPLLSRLGKRWRFRRAELALMIMTTLVAASITNNGLLRYFNRCLVMPIHLNQTQPGWQESGVLADVPGVMLANRGAYDERLTIGFIGGLAVGDERLAFSDVPWGMWAETLTFWGSVILLFAAAAICLAMVVHPQWSQRELLRYPIAEFARTLLSADAAGPDLPIYRRRWFRVGAAALLLYHLNNGLYAWWPDYLIRIRLQYDFSPLRELVPWLNYGWSYRMYYPAIWPTAVALAFFLAKDVAFSVGISQPVATALGAGLVMYGAISPGGNFITGNAFHWQRAGSCIALAVMLAYFGRHYYARILRCAVTGRSPAEAAERTPVFACRGLLFCLVALVLILVFAAHLPWPLAIAFVALTMVAYLAVARITAEVGIFYVQIIWFPIGVLLPLCGVVALGPTAFIVLALLSTVFVAQPEECVMPFAVQGLKIGESADVSPGRLGLAALLAFALALATAVPFSLWVDYSYGGCRTMSWDAYGQPRLPFSELQKAKARLEATDQLAESRALTSWQRLAAIRPNREFLWSSGLGFVLVLVTYMARLRWPSWPIHPVLFLIWDTWASANFFCSFLLAWFIKAVIDWVGSGPLYRNAKDLMIGVIAGELLGGLLWLVVGWVFYLVTAQTPPYYNIFPY